MINDLEASKFRASCSISPAKFRFFWWTWSSLSRTFTWAMCPKQIKQPVPMRLCPEAELERLGDVGEKYGKMGGIIPKWWNTFQMPGLLQPHNMWDDEWWWSPIDDFWKLLSIQVHIRHPDPGSGDIGDQGCSWCSAEISDTVRCRSGSSYLSLHAEQSGLEIKTRCPRCLFNRTHWQFMSILWILWHCWHSGDIWYIDLLHSALGCPDPRLNWMC